MSTCNCTSCVNRRGFEHRSGCACPSCSPTVGLYLDPPVGQPRNPVLTQLIEDIAEGIRKLEGVTEEQVYERARNIACALWHLYDIKAPAESGTPTKGEAEAFADRIIR